MNTIYAYSTSTYLEKSWIKVGQTSLDADSRIAQQDTTSNPEELRKLEEWSVPNKITDRHIHKVLERRGYLRTRVDKDREWFETTVEAVSEAINELRYGVSRKYDYAPREEQQACVDQAVQYFKDGGTEFLMNAKMRFGKTFASYLVAKELEAKSILVLTYKPATKDGWHEDLTNHVAFDGWSYADKYVDYAGIKTPKVLFASFQDINDLTKAKWKGIKKEHFDLLVIDEMHFGSDTARARKTMETLNTDRTLYVSGTPLDAILSGRFTEDNTYTWSYADEQKKRTAEKNSGWETDIYRWLPEMEIHTFEVSDEAKRNMAHYDTDEQFTMTKMFASDDGQTFIDEPSVKLFLDQVFGRGVRKTKSPMMTHAADHSLWVLPPNVASANSMSNLLERLVGDDYKIINVAGSGVTKLKDVKDQIARNDKTITVTVGRFNTGTTVPEWDTVFMMNDGRAPESYFQTIFRSQSPNKDRMKEKCFVFDFNPERTLDLVYTYAELTAKKGESTNSGLREFLEFCPVLDHTDNKVRRVDTEEIVKMMSESGGYIERMASNFLFDKDQSLEFESLMELTGSVKSSKRTVLVNANDVARGKNYTATAKAPSTNAEKKLADEIIAKAKVLTQKIPSYTLLVDPVESVEELMNTDPTDFEEHFEIPVEIFREMVESGFLRRDRLDRCITALLEIES